MVYGLYKGVRSSQDYQRIARDVGLRLRKISDENKVFFIKEFTTMRFPFHDVVQTAWSFAWGLPGSTVRMRMALGSCCKCARGCC